MNIRIEPSEQMIKHFVKKKIGWTKNVNDKIEKVLARHIQRTYLTAFVELYEK
jgi:hypothetical protein